MIPFNNSGCLFANQNFIFSLNIFLLFIQHNMIDIDVLSNAKFEKMKKKKVFIIHFGFHESPFGRCLIGLFGEKICHLSFVSALDSVNINVLKSQWPGCTFVNDQKSTLKIAKNIFETETGFLKVLLKGTSFEANIWKALIKIPKGETVSYEDVAVMSGHDRAVRAAAKAVAKNSVAYLVPCHRVIKKDGTLHEYRWGAHIKNKILQFENHCC